MIFLIKKMLIKLFGYRLLLVLGDTLVLDRYLWLLKYLPRTRQNEVLIDVGCGSGAFTLASGSRGYEAIGISWDKRNQEEAQTSAKYSGLQKKTKFEVVDIRMLDSHTEFNNSFDVCINFENMEHILDDRKLMGDIYDILKPGGILLFTTPYYFLSPISQSDEGPFSQEEDGGHVRRGYTRTMLKELCSDAGFHIEKISGCSGYFSQKITKLYRKFYIIHPLLAWVMILPFRVVPPLLDPLFRKLFGATDFSICMIASKPRLASPLS
jgi:2-polyprenyl-3-methyl-5-hydroxy-6-metoxy-1,4-benzoquinol methylase